MKRLIPWFVALFLAGCSLFETTPRPAPPAGPAPLEIQRDQSQGLVKIASVSVLERGSPQDAERAIVAKATAARADYYQILFIEETFYGGQWRAQAILYRQ